MFAQDEIAISRALDVNLGMRYSRHHLTAVVDIPATGRVDVDGSSDAVTGTVYRSIADAAPVAHRGVAQGFPCADVDDLTTFGTSAAGSSAQSRTRPETSVNYEGGVRVHDGLSAVHVVYFSSDYKDLIQRETGSYLGRHFVIWTETGGAMAANN